MTSPMSVADAASAAGAQGGNGEEKSGWYNQEWRKFRVFPHMDRAYRYINEGALDKAAAELETLLAAVPQETPAREMLVNLLLQTGDYDRALPHVDALLRDNPDSLSALWARVAILRHHLRHQGRLAEAAALLTRMRELSADSAEQARTLLELADVFIALQAWDKAAAALESLRTQPKQGQPKLEQALSNEQREHVILQLADLYLRLNQPEQALAALEGWEQAGLVPDFRLLSRRGALLARIVRLKAALSTYTAALPLAENSAEQRNVLNALAALYAQTGQDEQALQAVNRVLALNPTPAERLQATSTLAFLHVRSKRYAQAATAFTEALSLSPDDDALLAALGDVLYEQNHLDEAEIALGKALRLAPRSAYQLTMARILMRQGRPQDAESLLQAVTDPALRPEAFKALGEIAERLGRPVEAAHWYLEAHAALHGREPRLVLQAAQLLAQAGKSDEALKLLDAMGENALRASDDRRQAVMLRAELLHRKNLFAQARIQWGKALSLSGLTQAQRRHIVEQQGYAAQGDNDPKAAYAHFMQALRLGAESRDLRLQLAFTAFALKDYVAAKTHFASLLARRNYAAAHGAARMGLARVYAVTGQPGLAVDSLLQARPLLDARDTALMFDYYRELATAYAVGHRPQEAVQAYDEAYALKPGVVPECAQAVALRQAGQYERALTVWALLEADSSDAQCRRLAPWEQGRLYAALGDIAAALQQYALAAEANDNAELLREYGTLLRLQGQPEPALQAHTRALGLNAQARALESQSKSAEVHDTDAALLAERAYDNLSLARFEAATADMEAALALEPRLMALYPELGYTHKRLADNERSVDFFRQAIDHEPLIPVYTDKDRDALRIDVYKYRGEVAKLENRFDATFVWSASTGKTGRTENAAIARSASGLELAWTPPGTGFNDDRLVQLVGRAMWSSPPDSLEIPSRGIQGAVGLRVKPLRGQNLVFGVEKLFRLGEDAENNWLLRAMGSWGSEVRPFEPGWFYWSLFAEADYFVQSPARGALSSEARIGWTWNVGQTNTLFVTPHLVADAMYWTDNSYASYREAGVGLQVRYLFDETRYETPRSSVDWLIQYKVGSLFNTSGHHQGKNTHALFTTLSFGF